MADFRFGFSIPISRFRLDMHHTPTLVNVRPHQRESKRSDDNNNSNYSNNSNNNNNNNNKNNNNNIINNNDNDNDNNDNNNNNNNNKDSNINNNNNNKEQEQDRQQKQEHVLTEIDHDDNIGNKNDHNQSKNDNDDDNDNDKVIETMTKKKRLTVAVSDQHVTAASSNMDLFHNPVCTVLQEKSVANLSLNEIELDVRNGSNSVVNIADYHPSSRFLHLPLSSPSSLPSSSSPLISSSASLSNSDINVDLPFRPLVLITSPSSRWYRLLNPTSGTIHVYLRTLTMIVVTALQFLLVWQKSGWLLVLSQLLFTVLAFFLEILYIAQLLLWVDIRTATFILKGWEALYILAFTILFSFATYWISFSFQYDFPFVLVFLGVTVVVAQNLLGSLVALVSDACPRHFFTRRLRLVWFGSASLSYFTVYLSHFFNIRPITESNICIVICMPVSSLQASAAVTLCFFFLKFFISELFWSSRAVILKVPVVLNADDTLLLQL